MVERGIADPGKPVVPVAVAAGRLGQGGGRRCDNRAGRVVGEGLQDPAAGVHKLMPRALIALVNLRPGPPGHDRIPQPLRQFFLVPHPWCPPAYLAILKGEDAALAGRDGKPPERRAGPYLKSDRRGKHGDVSPATPGEAAVDVAQQWPDQPVLGTGHVFHLQLHLPRHRLDVAQQKARRSRAEGVPTVANAHGEGINEGGRTGRGCERGLKDHRLVQVTARGPEVTSGMDRPVPGLVVEQACEHGRAVEPRKTKPFHRSIPAHQGCRVAIGQQGMLPDGGGTHDRSPSQSLARVTRPAP